TEDAHEHHQPTGRRYHHRRTAGGILGGHPDGEAGHVDLKIQPAAVAHGGTMVAGIVDRLRRGIAGETSDVVATQAGSGAPDADSGSKRGTSSCEVGIDITSGDRWRWESRPS